MITCSVMARNAVDAGMDGAQRSTLVRRSSGLLVNASTAQGGETHVLSEVLRKLTTVMRAICANVRNINTSLESILMDKTDIEELEKMLNSLKTK